jgi:putative aldouronate transport system substrate-binding protein
VRSDIAKRCGITQISTIEDVDNALQTIRDKESIIPIYKDSVSPKILMGRKRFITLTSPFLYKKDDPTMKVLPIEQFDEYSKASELFIKWKNSGYFAEAGLDKTASFFANGLGIIDYYRKEKISGDYKLFSLYDSDGIYENQEYVYGIAINKDSKKAEHVLRFLEWVYSEQSNYDLIMYGIEGKNYTLKNDRLIPQENHGLINWYGSLSFLNYNFERLYENDPDFFKEIYKSFLISEYQMPPHYGFIPDLSELSDKLREIRYSGEQQRIRKEAFEGTSDMTIGEYIQYQKGLGADDIAKEIQTQLNAWLLKNKQ